MCFQMSLALIMIDKHDSVLVIFTWLKLPLSLDLICWLNIAFTKGESLHVWFHSIFLTALQIEVSALDAFEDESVVIPFLD